MSDLVERLRAWVRPAGTNVDLPLYSEAAEEIRLLREDCDRMQASNTEFRNVNRELRAENAQLQAEVERLQIGWTLATSAVDEHTRLRAALTPFAQRAARFDDIPGVCHWNDDVELWQDGNWRCDLTVGDLRRARRALEQARKE